MVLKGGGRGCPAHRWSLSFLVCWMMFAGRLETCPTRCWGVGLFFVAASLRRFVACSHFVAYCPLGPRPCSLSGSPLVTHHSPLLPPHPPLLCLTMSFPSCGRIRSSWRGPGGRLLARWQLVERCGRGRGAVGRRCVVGRRFCVSATIRFCMGGVIPRRSSSGRRRWGMRRWGCVK